MAVKKTKVKLKTNRGAMKRFKRTAKGQYKHRRAYRNHILTKKSIKRKRGLRAMALVPKAAIRMIARMLKHKS